MYNKLSKEEKKDIRKRFRNTNKGENVLKPLDRLFLEGIFLIASAIGIFVYIFTVDTIMKWIFFWSAIGILVFGLFFLIGQYIIRIKNYNNYINYLEKNKKSKKRLTKKK